ncbi:MAG: VOC family protein [Sphingopyxis sp.]|uniref:VOC family protein n=1 Tax=Sphingopyxis sp. TaxID=1908224 RepID=UPI003D8120AD
MIGYVTMGTRDLDRAREFYAALLGTIGATELMRMSDADNGFTLYATGWGQPGIAVTRPYDGRPADPGNGHMAAIIVDERAKVDALHAQALALGGTCEGPPGVRGEEGDQAFYGAYFRDLDGNKLCAFRIGAA